MSNATVPPTLSRTVYRGYAAVFIASGLASLAAAHLEFPLWFGVDAPPGLLNQYRFLRAIEVGFGLLLWELTDAFFAGGRLRRLILAAFVLIPLARLIGIVVDGWPPPEFLALVVAETALVFGLSWASREKG